MRQTQRQHPERPHQRRQQELPQRAEEKGLHPEEPARPEIGPEAAGPGHMDQIGHHETLEPARPLPDPGPGAAGRLLIGDGVEQFGAIAAP